MGLLILTEYLDTLELLLFPFQLLLFGFFYGIAVHLGQLAWRTCCRIFWALVANVVRLLTRLNLLERNSSGLLEPTHSGLLEALARSDCESEEATTSDVNQEAIVVITRVAIQCFGPQFG